MHDYGDRVRPSVVDLMSLRGIRLSLRYRVGTSLAIVVRGKALPADMEAVRAAIGKVPA